MTNAAIALLERERDAAERHVQDCQAKLIADIAAEKAAHARVEQQRAALNRAVEWRQEYERALAKLAA